MRFRSVVALSAFVICSDFAFGQGNAQSSAYSADLLADATSRISSAAAAEAEAMPQVGGAIQFRYDMNWRQDYPGASNLTNGFQASNTTLWVGGTVHDSFEYYVQANFYASTGSLILQDAYVVRDVGEGWSLGAGQFCFPVLWEDYVDPWRLLDLDYSPTNNVFSPGRIQGVYLNYTGSEFRAWGAFDDGVLTANTDYLSPIEADYALTGRAELKFAGDWDQFDDLNSFRNSEIAAKLGGAFHWQSGGNTVDTIDADILLATIDLCLEGNGCTAYASGIYRSIDAAGAATLNDWGFVVQGGYFVTEKWELFARYDVSHPDDGSRPGDQTAFNTFTLGANYFLIPDSEAVRFGFDICYFPDNQSESIVSPSTETGVLADDQDGQINLRAQIQMLF